MRIVGPTISTKMALNVDRVFIFVAKSICVREKLANKNSAPRGGSLRVRFLFC